MANWECNCVGIKKCPQCEDRFFNSFRRRGHVRRAIIKALGGTVKGTPFDPAWQKEQGLR